MRYDFPVSILYKSIAGRQRPVSFPDGPITARYSFIKIASWVCGEITLMWNTFWMNEKATNLELEIEIYIYHQHAY